MGASSLVARQENGDVTFSSGVVINLMSRSLLVYPSYSRWIFWEYAQRIVIREEDSQQCTDRDTLYNVSQFGAINIELIVGFIYPIYQLASK